MRKGHEVLDARSVYDRLAAVYDTAYADGMDEAEDSAIRPALSRLSWPILDLGCGTVNGAWGRQPPPGYVGVDVSLRMAQAAKRKHPGAALVVADAARLPLSAAGLPFGSLAALFGIINVVQDPRAIIAAALGACSPRPDAFLMFATPARARRPFPGQQAALMRYYTMRDVRRIVAPLGPGVRFRGLRGPVARACGAALVGLEYATLARALPGQCDYIIAERLAARGKA